MDRRRIPSIPRSGPHKGEFATKWEGFRKALRKGYWNIGNLREWKPRPIGYKKGGFRGVENVDDCCGVYVFLNKDKYVLYVGKSAGTLAKRIKKSFTEQPPSKRGYIRYVTAHRVTNAVETSKMEAELLWYYTPPWNTRFTH